MHIDKKTLSSKASSAGATGGTGALTSTTQKDQTQSSERDTGLVIEKSPDDFSYEGDTIESVEPNHDSETKHRSQRSADY